jgi:hypothetical protein
MPFHPAAFLPIPLVFNADHGRWFRLEIAPQVLKNP